MRAIWKAERVNRETYSQGGEDLIVESALSELGIEKPYYLDIGANHPIEMNNTYLFYRKGCRGVCVEPDPLLAEEFRTTRPEDLLLNIGVDFDDRQSSDFYIMSMRTLNTMSKEQAEAIHTQGNYQIAAVMKIELCSVNEIIRRHCAHSPNFISIDVEGLDLQILKTLDFRRIRPDVLCVETVDFITHRRLPEIVEFMQSQDYIVFADTAVNTVFVSRPAWNRRSFVRKLKRRAKHISNKVKSTFWLCLAEFTRPVSSRKRILA